MLRTKNSTNNRGSPRINGINNINMKLHILNYTFVAFNSSNKITIYSFPHITNANHHGLTRELKKKILYKNREARAWGHLRLTPFNLINDCWNWMICASGYPKFHVSGIGCDFEYPQITCRHLGIPLQETHCPGWFT